MRATQDGLHMAREEAQCLFCGVGFRKHHEIRRTAKSAKCEFVRRALYFPIWTRRLQAAWMDVALFTSSSKRANLVTNLQLCCLEAEAKKQFDCIRKNNTSFHNDIMDLCNWAWKPSDHTIRLVISLFVFTHIWATDTYRTIICTLWLWDLYLMRSKAGSLKNTLQWASAFLQCSLKLQNRKTVLRTLSAKLIEFWKDQSICKPKARAKVLPTAHGRPEASKQNVDQSYFFYKNTQVPQVSAVSDCASESLTMVGLRHMQFRCQMLQ